MPSPTPGRDRAAAEAAAKEKPAPTEVLCGCKRKAMRNSKFCALCKPAPKTKN